MQNVLATVSGKVVIEVNGLCVVTRHGVTFQSQSLLDCIKFIKNTSK